MNDAVSACAPLRRVRPEPRRVLEDLAGVPFTEGNRVDVLRNGEEAFPAMLEAIDASTRSIDLLWFLWGKGAVTDEVAAALTARARAGVRVRVLLDGFGARGIDRSQLSGLRSAGAQVEFYRPVPGWRITAANMRTHRRALVCDEQVGFTGGTGIDRAWTGDGSDPAHWRDSSFRIRGPAVAGIRSAFAMAWVQAPHPLIGDRDCFPPQPRAGHAAVQILHPSSQPGWNEATVALLALLHTAQERVCIASPYVRLPAPLRDALTAAARRGVAVQLLLAGRHADRRAVHVQGARDYEPLLEAGVELWHYQPSMLHTKVVMVDDSTAMMGTVNLDTRSLALNEQVALVVDDTEVAAVLGAHFAEDLSRSRRTTLDRWRRRGARRRVAEVVADTVGRPLRGLGSAGLTAGRPR